jgi:hypothetical protein
MFFICSIFKVASLLLALSICEVMLDFIWGAEETFAV